MNSSRSYIYLAADSMSKYTLADYTEFGNIIVINKVQIFCDTIRDCLSKIWLSNSLNNIFNLPYKKVIYKMIFSNFVKDSDDICFIVTPAWFDKQLFAFLRKEYPKCKIIMRFGDMIEKKLKTIKAIDINYLKNKSDLVIVYNYLDAKKYGFVYLPMGYSKVPTYLFKKKPKVDVVFIGAAKDRLKDIQYAYQRFRENGVTCFFYITGVPKEEQDKSGIIYSDKGMSFVDYLSYELSATCLFEILQSNTTGRTFRMMEAIIYNKLLITNCTEIIDTEYNNSNVQVFSHVSEINYTFPFKQIIPNNYKGDFSPINLLDLIDLKIFQ